MGKPRMRPLPRGEKLTPHEKRVRDRARAAVRYALVTGKIVKPSVCEDCKETVVTEAHHINYNRPLVVNWVCKICHHRRHCEVEGNRTIGRGSRSSTQALERYVLFASGAAREKAERILAARRAK